MEHDDILKALELVRLARRITPLYEDKRGDLVKSARTISDNTTVALESIENVDISTLMLPVRRVDTKALTPLGSIHITHNGEMFEPTMETIIAGIPDTLKTQVSAFAIDTKSISQDGNRFEAEVNLFGGKVVEMPLAKPSKGRAPAKRSKG